MLRHLTPKKIKPPFFQIKSVQIIVCHKWYALNVQENSWSTGEIRNHTVRCDPATLPGEDQVRARIVEYLESRGYDVTSLK